MFVLVRHAVAVSKQKWSSDDSLRPLNRTGLRQSHDLVGLLRELGVTGLLSSPTERCRMTLAPTSETLSVPIVFSDALTVESPTVDLLSLVSSASIQNAALCTHGEALAALSRAWADSWPDGSRSPDLTDTPKGGAWLIENYGSRAPSAKYLGAPATRRAPLRLAG